jgi:hypothetical protein
MIRHKPICLQRSTTMVITIIFIPPFYPECPGILCGLYFHPPVDDDDSVVFEDDADENEGYLFAGQCTNFNLFMI